MVLSGTTNADRSSQVTGWSWSRSADPSSSPGRIFRSSAVPLWRAGRSRAPTVRPRGDQGAPHSAAIGSLALWKRPQGQSPAPVVADATSNPCTGDLGQESDLDALHSAPLPGRSGDLPVED